MSSHPPPSSSAESIVAYHEALKLNGQWNSLPSIGVQDFGGTVLDLRNCPACHSTLARKVSR